MFKVEKKIVGICLLIVFAGGLLSSCARSDNGAPVIYRNSNYKYSKQSGAAAPQRDPRDGAVIVRKGDTLYSVSRSQNVDLRSLIEVNRLRPPYTLAVGQTLNIPKPRYYTVKKGETVYSISRQHGVDMSSLASMNDVRPPYAISVGQQLKIPGRELNWMQRQKTWLRSSGQSSTTVATAQPKTVTPPRNPPKPNKSVRAGGRFLWPVNGRVISGFGSKGDGLHNDGINVAVPEGAPVFASDDGVVTYTGNELKGYGNLILVRHSSSWVSAYSHTRKIRVQRGAKVTRGQHIADAGKTGSVTRPQLHFELRRGSKAVDPLNYLSTQ